MRSNSLCWDSAWCSFLHALPLCQRCLPSSWHRCRCPRCSRPSSPSALSVPPPGPELGQLRPHHPSPSVACARGQPPAESPHRQLWGDVSHRCSCLLSACESEPPIPAMLLEAAWPHTAVESPGTSPAFGLQEYLVSVPLRLQQWHTSGSVVWHWGLGQGRPRCYNLQKCFFPV